MRSLAGIRTTTGTESATVRAPTFGFAAVAAGLVILRFATMVRSGAPVGADGGNWLAFGHALLGEHIRPSSIVYPPLVPLAVAAAVAVLGLTAGIAAVAALSSVAPAVAIFAVLRSQGLGWPATLLAGITAAASVSGEPAAWGGYPQLLGIALLLLFLWRLDAALRGPSPGPAAARWAGVLLALVAATSHLIAAGAVAAGAALVGVHLAWPAGGERMPARTLARAGLWLVLPSLLLVPLYVRLGATVGASVADRGGTDPTGFAELLRRLDLLHAEFTLLGRVLLLAAPVILAVLWSRRSSPLWAMAAASLAGGLAVVVVTREVRFVYLLPPGAVLAMGLWFTALEAERPAFAGARRVATGLLAAALVVQVVLGAGKFGDQVRYYEAVDRDLVAAIDWVRDGTPSGSVVVVSPIHDWPLVWWVEGWGRRPALGASSLQWLNFPDERRRARIANAVIGLSAPSPAVLDRARSAGGGYVLVAKAWPGFSPTGLAEVRGAVVFENASAVVLATT